MDNVIFAIWLVTYVVGAVRYVLYLTHMFQQNSYKPREYGEWLRVHTNVGRLLGKCLYAVVSLPLMLVGNTGCLIAACLLNGMTILVNKPHKAKKPLVYTPRVKRLLVTTGIVWGLVLLLVAFPWIYVSLWGMTVLHNGGGGIHPLLRNLGFTLLLLFLLQPVLILLVNLINHPIEMGINRHYIGEAAQILRKMPELRIIGVTGSYGKTSVKYFLNTLLSAQYNVLCTPGNYNTTLGVVRTIREHMKPFHEIFICEMGARQVGDIKEICDLVHPHYGVITSIGPQHLQSFHTMENIVSTKFELADAVPDTGKVFLNYDNEYIRGHRTEKNVVSYGAGEAAADFRAYDIRVSAKGSSFRMKDENGEVHEFHTRLVGSHNVQNIAGAIAVAHTLGISMEKLLYPVRQLESVPHRLQLIRQGDRIILDDAYNSNKNGFEAALDTLAMFQELRILLTPGMVELGEKQYEENKEAGVYAADKCDYAILVGKEQTKPIQDGLLEAGFPQNRMILVDTLQEAFQMVNAIPDERQKVILLENDLPDVYA
ncbi:MAG: UDP-N-acetylmuramoyl-tripeptide--D-alanyl-D-alanine ligase [Bacteroidales bacterium]|nr:UDP-N-acetylmuramoyl-tripeptide--D-alanyl-D-alanine ligase [Bacteroidales bacterium]MCM1416762.1 UDP-N-acetylmuramoyl-tripeptide--D-alanyl-D-alanine ligase [bacterium]MCM1424740.1 UDP-N-acetylmuramoyl-tripeptide--D-alanyl-D-alanine ligase [bacterium]